MNGRVDIPLGLGGTSFLDTGIGTFSSGTGFLGTAGRHYLFF